MKWTPRLVTVEENNPAFVTQIDVIAKDPVTGDQVAYTHVPPDPSGTTIIPIGSNAFFDALTDGQEVNLFIGEIAALGHGPNTLQPFPDNPYTIRRLVDGAENIVVTL